ncbi:MAG: hypothetical protein WC455_12860 [Dehalococcoidia bacterium]
MIDAEVCQWLDEARATGRVIDADCLETMIIPWGSDCCHGCELYECGKSITAWGFCPVMQRQVSPHYFCEKWEQD